MACPTNRPGPASCWGRRGTPPGGAIVALMTGTTVRIPSVRDTVRTYLVRSVVGDDVGRLRSVIWLPIVILVILAVPRVDSVSEPLGPLVFFLIGGVLNALEAAQREYRFGGPRRVVVTAGVTTFVCSMTLLVTLISISITFGPERGSSAIEALGAAVPANLLIGGLLLLMVAAAAAYWINEPARTRDESENRARIRAERLARGRAVRP